MMQLLRHRRRMIREFERRVRKRWVFLNAFLVLGDGDSMYGILTFLRFGILKRENCMYGFMFLGVGCRNDVSD